MTSSVYPGSSSLSGVAHALGCQIDQLNFLLSQLLALAAAALFGSRLAPQRAGSSVRHLTSAVLGLVVLFFCYGRDGFHMVNLAMVSYAVMRFAPVQYVHRISLVVAMSYLSAVHIHRLLDPVDYFDISAPLMVLVMKVTLLAHNVHDGSRHGAPDLAKKQYLMKMSVSGVPGLVSFLGYAFNFHTVHAGPSLDFVHYRHFIEQGLSPVETTCADKNANRRVLVPSPGRAVLGKVAVGSLTTVCVFYLVPQLPHSFFKDAEFYRWSASRQWLYMFGTGLMARMRYYTAWLLADAICNASGLGFNGVDADGTQRWDALTNVDIVKVECSGSFRELLAGWNKGTGRWLRAVAYDRAGSATSATVGTYALSAVWHGFHPCYYVTFSIGALCTVAERSCRRLLRPQFERTIAGRIGYSALGCLATRAAVAYLQMPFVMLDLYTTLRVYRDLYFAVHVVCLTMIVLLPCLYSPSSGDTAALYKSSASVERRPGPCRTADGLAAPPQGRSGVKRHKLDYDALAPVFSSRAS